ncbi:hypothetical protein [Flavobacterium sp. XGLA_31]|uniref:hypothetical protein n=1 Tax=Flavobacterium sp. XGLA_31 TaxID=3447666 RepID=UPI003F2F4C8D
MESDKIEILLEKYFEAETTTAEEKELKKYFSSPDVAQHLEHYKPLFDYALRAKQEQPANTKLKLNSRRGFNMFWISVAATVIVLLGVGLLTFQNQSRPHTQDLGTIEDPQVAFRETQKALNMISEHVNKGIGSMSYLKEYQQSKDKIFKK